MKTKKLISAVSLILIAFAIMNCTKANAKVNRLIFFSKTIKEGILQSQMLHENKKHSAFISPEKKIYLDKDNKKAYLGAMRIIKNEINPRIHFTSYASVCSKDLKSAEGRFHFNRLTIICLGRFIVPAANVLLLLF